MSRRLCIRTTCFKIFVDMYLYLFLLFDIHFLVSMQSCDLDPYHVTQAGNRGQNGIR